jgi:hypothetical protein
MAHKLNPDVANNTTNPLHKKVIGVVGILVILSGLIACGVLDRLNPQPPPPTASVDITKIVLEIEATRMSALVTELAAQSLSTDPTVIALKVEATQMSSLVTQQAAQLLFQDQTKVPLEIAATYISSFVTQQAATIFAITSPYPTPPSPTP